jgi:kinesin family protein 6/9
MFMIKIEAQDNGSDVKTSSTLNLVDLSGSERPSKTGIDGNLLSEANAINTSLHFLE